MVSDDIPLQSDMNVDKLFFISVTELNVDIFEKRLGTFYRFTNQEKFVPIKTEIGVSNGLTWNSQTNKFYYIDSCDLDVKEFDYDPKTGDICKYNSIFYYFTHEIFRLEWQINPYHLFACLQPMDVLLSILQSMESDRASSRMA